MDLVFSRTKKIPSKSWGQECSLCSSRHGVPIECSAVGCKAAYHTTCAIRGKLKMQAIFGKDFKGGIKLRSYCKDHSPSMGDECGTASQADKIDANGVKEIDMTNLVDDRLQESNEELDYFWKYVDINEVHKNMNEAYKRMRKLRIVANADQQDTQMSSSPSKKSHKKSTPQQEQLKKRSKTKNSSLESTSNATIIEDDVHHEVDPLSLDLIYRYWTLLRTVHNGQSLIKFSPSALKEREFEQRKSILKLRIELERVRNLSYMIGKREKLKASWLKTHQNIIKRTFSVINDLKPTSDPQPCTEEPVDDSISGHNNHHHNLHFNTLVSNKKAHQQTAQHLQPINGIFDESDQLINDLISCDQIYDVDGSSTSTVNNNHSNLSHQERSTLERRRTLSLVRRINRQLKSFSVEPSMNPYAKSYLALKRSNSPIVPQTSTASSKLLKYR